MQLGRIELPTSNRYVKLQRTMVALRLAHALAELAARLVICSQAAVAASKAQAPTIANPPCRLSLLPRAARMTSPASFVDND